MADESDVPPLEDMSELLAHVEVLKEAKSKTGSSYRTNRTSTAQNGHHNIQAKEAQITSISSVPASHSLSSSSPLSSNISSSNSPSSSTIITSTPSSSSSQSSSTGIFGFKKGFLLGGSSKPKPERKPANSSDKTTNIPYIKKKENQKENLKFPEVQKLMTDAESLTKNTDAWVTEDLLKKVEQNDDLFKKLGEKKYMEAIHMFQSNPTQAMERYKHDVQVQEFFKKFMGIMGEHFTNIADKDRQQNEEQKKEPKSKIVELDNERKENPGESSSVKSYYPHTYSSDTVLTRSPDGADISVRSSTNPNQPTFEDEKKMQEILSNPEIRNILMDQKVFGMIETLRRNPSEGQRMFATADSETKGKIQKLVQCGLLQFQA